MRLTILAASVSLAALSYAAPALADHGADAQPATQPGAPSEPPAGTSVGERVVYRVDCDSNGYGHSRCEAPQGVYVFRVVLTRQDSATPCVEGENWGVDPRGVWVDDGCAAEFRLFGRDVGAAAPESLSCGSSNYDRANCRATDLVFSARLERQRSSAACVEDESWGWDQFGVWVDGGCRADFLLNDPRDGGPFGAGVWTQRGGGGHGASRGYGSGGRAGQGPAQGVGYGANAHPATVGDHGRGWGAMRGVSQGGAASSTPASGDPYAVDTHMWRERGFDGGQEAVALCSRRIMRAAWEDADYSAQFERAPEMTPADHQVASLAPAAGQAWRVTGPVIVHNRYGYERIQVVCTVENGGVSTFQARAQAPAPTGAQ